MTVPLKKKTLSLGWFSSFQIQELKKQTKQMLAGRKGWIKNPMCSPFRHSNGGTSLGTCPFKQEKPEFGMVLFLPDPTVEEADKTNVGWQNSIPLVKKTFLQS